MLAVIVLYCLVNLVLQSFIQPRYVGEAVGLSTSLTMVSLIFWTWCWVRSVPCSPSR